MFAHRTYLFAVDLSWRLPNSTGSIRYQEVADWVLDQDLSIRAGGYTHSAKVRDCGPLLAQKLAESTSAIDPTSDIAAGQPTLVIEDRGGGEMLDSTLRRIKGRPSTVAVYYGQSGIAPAACWVLRSEPTDRQGLQSLRLHRISYLRTASEMGAIAISADRWQGVHLYEVASEALALLVDATTADGPTARVALNAVSAFRVHRPVEYEYLLAGGGTQNPASQFLRMSLTQTVDWEMDRGERRRESYLGARRTLYAAADRGVQDLHAERSAESLSEMLDTTKKIYNINWEVRMGDTFENISGSTIVNRSAVVDSFNRSTDADLVSELTAFARSVEQHGGTPEACDLAEAFVAEAAGDQRKTILQTLWSRLRELAPVAAASVAVGSKVYELVS